jgi:phosphoglucomutase/phosphomannomutase
VACFDVLTGFKYVAEKIREWDHSKDYNYVFGGEESYGYLYGTSTRDKDALSAAALICEIALEAKLQGKTLIDNLLAIYRKYGLFHETLKSIKFPETKEGREQMSVGLKNLRQNPPRDIGGIPIQTCEDYLTRVDDRSYMIVFWLTDGSKLVIRPSGTEPKIKIYCGVSAPAFEDYDKSIVELELKCEKLVDALKSLLS